MIKITITLDVRSLDLRPFLSSYSRGWEFALESPNERNPAKFVELENQASQGGFMMNTRNQKTCVKMDQENQSENRFVSNKAAHDDSHEEQLLRTLIDSMPDFVNLKDEKVQWLVANDFALNLYGLKGVSYIGKTDAELSYYSTEHKEALLACRDSDLKAIQSEKPLRIQETMQMPNGSIRVGEN